MMKFISLAMALILVSGVLTGCGCSANVGETTVPSTAATTVPTTAPTTVPITQATTEPATQPATRPATQPTTPSSQPTQSGTDDTMPGMIDGNDGANGTIGSDATTGMDENGAARRMPGMRRR